MFDGTYYLYMWLCGWLFSIWEYLKYLPFSQWWLKFTKLYHPYNFQQWKTRKEHENLCYLLFHKFPPKSLVHLCHEKFILHYLLLLSVCASLMQAWIPMCMLHVEVRSHLCEVGFLLPPLCGFQGFNLDYQASVISGSQIIQILAWQFH